MAFGICLAAAAQNQQENNMRRARSGIGVATGVVLFAAAAAATLSAQPSGQPGDRQPPAISQPRVLPLPEAQWTDVHRTLVKKYSRDDSAFRTFLNTPGAIDGLMPFTIYTTERSTLMSRHRGLLILRALWLCGNRAQWPVQAAAARKAGLSAAEIRRVAEGPEAAGWEAFDRTLLRLADQLYRNSSVTDATWQELSASYDVPHLMDAVETVNHFVFLSMLENSFGIQPDTSATDRLPTDVPYRVTVPPRQPALKAARIEPVKGSGDELAVSRTFARHPALNQSRSPRAGFVNRVSPLSPRHREILILRIGWNCQSEYEWAQHVGRVGRAREHGLDPVLIARGPSAPGWDPFEATLLRAADELYRDTVISDATWQALAARYDIASLMSAVFTVSSYRATSMALNAFGVQLEPGDERFPNVPSH
jgi:alkylhydroperoxidase family enzyme